MNRMRRAAAVFALSASCASTLELSSPATVVRTAGESVEDEWLRDDQLTRMRVALAPPDPASSFRLVVAGAPRASRDDDVCEMRFSGKGTRRVQWRTLPRSVHQAITEGRVRDALTAYIEGNCIAHCGSAGCWLDLKRDENGCGLICDRYRMCDADEPPPRADRRRRNPLD